MTPGQDDVLRAVATRVLGDASLNLGDLMTAFFWLLHMLGLFKEQNMNLYKWIYTHQHYKPVKECREGYETTFKQ